MERTIRLNSLKGKAFEKCKRTRNIVKTENFKKVTIASQQELREWLTKSHQQEESVWLGTFKKIEKDRYVSTSQVLDELISFGWIDGIRRKLDDKKPCN